MHTMRTGIALATALAISATAAGAATIENHVAGLKLIMLDKYGLGKAKVVYVAKGDPGIQKGPGIAAKGDPINLTGTVQVIQLSDPSNAASYDLPDPWLVNKTTVGKYVNKAAAPGGPGAKVVVVKPGLVGKLVAKNLGDNDSASGDNSATDFNLQAVTDPNDTIRVIVTVNNGVDGNTYVFCSDYSNLSIKLDNASQPFKVLSKSSTAPSSCAVGPSIPNCCGPSRSTLKFTTGIGSGTCGTTVNSSGTTLVSLNCGSLYIGGGQNSVPPAAIPDLGESRTKVTSCNSITGAQVLGAATSADTGSNRNCTATGCLFGAPLPIPNPSSPPTSTCVINSVSSNASGSGNCQSGASQISIPLSSQIFLTGDLLPDAGIQPCPLCTGGTCKGGPNDGLACTPGTTAATASYPTSHDCPPPPAQDIGSLPIAFSLTTGSTSKTAAATGTEQRVFCGFCRDQTAAGTGTFEQPFRACTTDANCTNVNFPDCEQRNNGAFGPPTGGSAKTIIGTGQAAGNLTDGLPHTAKLVSIFCIPPTFNSTVDNAGDLPGPGFSALQGQAQLQ